MTPAQPARQGDYASTIHLKGGQRIPEVRVSEYPRFFRAHFKDGRQVDIPREQVERIEFGNPSRPEP